MDEIRSTDDGDTNEYGPRLPDQPASHRYAAIGLELALLLPVLLTFLYAVIGVGLRMAGLHLPPSLAWLAGLVVFLSLAAASLHATARLFDYADELDTNSTAWRPNPWVYVFVGTMTLTLVAFVSLGAASPSIPGPTANLRLLFSLSLVATVYSAIVSGPLFVLQATRHGYI